MSTHKTIRGAIFGLASMAVTLTGCAGGGEEEGGLSGTTEQASPDRQTAASPRWPLAPSQSTDAEDAPEAQIADLDQVLERTSAIIEGDVSLFSHEYSESEGPRTIYRVSNISVHLASPQAKIEPTLLLRVFGGPLPDGRSVAATHIAPLVDGKRHVLFLERDRWWASPVIYRYGFTVEKVGERFVVVDQHGRLLTGISSGGLETGPRVLSLRDELRPERGTFVDRTLDDGSGLTVEDFVQLLRGRAARNATSMTGAFSASPALFGPSWRAIPAASQEGPAVSTEEASAAARRLECMRDVQRALKAEGIRDSRPGDFDVCPTTTGKGE